MTIQSTCQALSRSVATKSVAIRSVAIRSVATRSVASRTAAAKPFAPQSLRRPNCPRCGSRLLIAEDSRFNAQGCVGYGRIDHDWSCDCCGHQFATSVRLGRR